VLHINHRDEGIQEVRPLALDIQVALASPALKAFPLATDRSRSPVERQLTFLGTPATISWSQVDRGGAFVSTQTQIRPEEDIGTGLGQPWMVILFNDDYHAFDEVIAQVRKATGCSPGEAFQITYAAHTNGQAVAYVGDKPRCEQVAEVLREIDLHVKLEGA